jgi:hypothetical protein
VLQHAEPDLVGTYRYTPNWWLALAAAAGAAIGVARLIVALHS